MVYGREFFDLIVIDLNAIVVYKITRFIDVNFCSKCVFDFK